MAKKFGKSPNQEIKADTTEKSPSAKTVIKGKDLRVKGGK